MRVYLPTAINLLFCGVYRKASYESNPKAFYTLTSDKKLIFVQVSGAILKGDEDIDIRRELSDGHRIATSMIVYN